MLKILIIKLCNIYIEHYKVNIDNDKDNIVYIENNINDNNMKRESKCRFINEITVVLLKYNHIYKRVNSIFNNAH